MTAGANRIWREQRRIHRRQFQIERWWAAALAFLFVVNLAFWLFSPVHGPLGLRWLPFFCALISWASMVLCIRSAERERRWEEIWMGDGLAYREAFHQLPPEERRRMLFGERPS